MTFPTTHVNVGKLVKIFSSAECTMAACHLSWWQEHWAEYCSLVPDSAAGAQLFIQDFSNLVNCKCPQLFQGGEDDNHEQCTRHLVQRD